MPRIAGKVIATKIVDGAMLAKIQLNGKLPPSGERVTVKWGRSRSNSQNALYWLYLTFLWQDCNLKDEYSTVDELHETLKATFLSKRVFAQGLEFIKVGSTTTLDKLTFGEYLSRIDKAMVEYQHLNTAPFWEQYKKGSEEIDGELTEEGKKWMEGK